MTIILLVLLAATPGLALKPSVDPQKTHLVISPTLSFPFGSFSDIAGVGGGLSVDYRRPLDASIELTASVGGLLFAKKKGSEQLFPIDAGLNVPTSLELESRLGTSIFPAKIGVRYIVDNNIFLKLELGDLYSRVEREGIITRGTEKGVTLGRTETNSHGLLISIGLGLARGMHRGGLELNYSPRGSGPLNDSDLAWLAIFFGI